MFLGFFERSIESDPWVGDPPTCRLLSVALEALEVMVVVRIDQVRFNLMLKCAHLTRG